MNPIGEAGVEALLAGVAKNPTIKLVGIDVSISQSEVSIEIMRPIFKLVGIDVSTS